MISLASDSTDNSMQSEDPIGLPDSVILAARRWWRLAPRIRRAVKQPVGLEYATYNLPQLGKWAAAFPGCDWVLVTGISSGVIVLETDAECSGLAIIQSLGEVDWPETLHSRNGNKLLAFFRYPAEMRARQKGKIVLAPGLAVRGDEDEVVLPLNITRSWPKPNAPLMEAPEWLRICAFEPDEEEEAGPLPPKIPPRMEIVGGNRWKGGNNTGRTG